MGNFLRFIWAPVGSIAGFVALVAAIIWGAKSAVQVSPSLIAWKALPVPGGVPPIPSVNVGGPIFDIGERV